MMGETENKAKGVGKTPEQVVDEWWERQELETRFEPADTEFGVVMACASEAIGIHLETQARVACALERVAAAIEKVVAAKVLS